MKRLFTRDNAIRLLLIVALGGTVWKGFLKTPEAASHLRPKAFYDDLVNDGENTAIMKERHRDVLEATDKAVRVRLDELRAGVYVPGAGSLVSEESLVRAIRKDVATRARAVDDEVRAWEKLERARRLEASGWRMPLGCSPVAAAPASGQAAPGGEGGQ
ncbi:hypothetical protein DFW101_2109 [Solidesulfovibrio carbinoliphilus subsp. oakridgensis]|uniref:Uncharacterized protein n=1 Tax=Solidesulfovibrio carbinoliphilus subsp. oakridgensis TaxID=694327 RepID=G7Q8A1_9BACT|nr:hypothetical protein [Solidesulfovibrio carbinoliphilus]EHJ48115.1 hypothetical protein DFW101_2109 [Solidesulfovibrio carbinoliphilus subsp. oakridgensis]